MLVFRTRWWLLILAAGSLALPTAAFAQRLPAPQLLPDTTLVYLRISNVQDLVGRFQKTASGRILSDPRVKPLLNQLYGSAAEAYQQIEDGVGVPLDRLLAIPQGEACLAVVPPAEGAPQILAWFDAGDRVVDARQLLERLEQGIVSQGGSRSTERAGDVELTVLQPPGERSRRLVLSEKDEHIIFSTDTDLAKQLLAVWSGQKSVKSLSENRRFTAIMGRCQGDANDPPQAVWYVDPIELIRRAGRGDFSTQAGLAMLGGLGLDGLQAVGGGITLATEQFDGVMHAHLLLETPREGVLKMVNLASGDNTPEPWVPRDAAAYVTLHWDVPPTYAELMRLHDIFRGEDAWKSRVAEPFQERTGIDLEKDIVNALAGRLSWVTWMERPPRLNSQSSLVGVKLADAAATRQVLERIRGKFPDRFTEESFGGVNYYRLGRRGNREGNREVEDQTVRQPTPSVAILGDYLVVTDSVKFLQQAIITKQDPTESLANELDFKLIAGKIGRQLNGVKPGMTSFNRPEEGLRNMYEMANSPTIRSQLASRAANNRFFKALNDALVANPLPPFSVLAQYLAPGGAMLTSDDTGIHYTAFTLRRE